VAAALEKFVLIWGMGEWGSGEMGKWAILTKTLTPYNPNTLTPIRFLPRKLWLLIRKLLRFLTKILT
jgi:hypothetical protein